MMPATARLAIFVVVVISPQPVTPKSVRTSTKKYSPQYVPAAFTNQGTNFVIFMDCRLLLAALSIRSGVRKGKCGARVTSRFGEWQLRAAIPLRDWLRGSCTRG